MFDKLSKVELVESNVDLSDFLFANGNFKKETYETLSYITGDVVLSSGESYLTPPTELPKSETQGLGKLDLQDNSFVNLPPLQPSYITRGVLERDLREELLKDNHPIVTLKGPGGTGKTSLALQVLYGIAKETKRFGVIVWFSSRDVDLFSDGPKPVKPHMLNLKEFSKEFARLIEPEERQDKKFDPVVFFSKSLERSEVGPTLFVFDNFETIDGTSEMFKWIDTYIRPPNKALITTRIRDFRGDYFLEVRGMEWEESRSLINSVSRSLGIQHFVHEQYAREIYKESEGHPYVMKILLGEVEKEKTRVKPRRIIASQDDILTALFERSYARLSAPAKRIFLLLSNWRSVVPEFAVELTVLRSDTERMDVIFALNELQRTSFIEEISPAENCSEEKFISVPLASLIFGRKKLSVSPMKSIIEADSEFLKAFGASRKEDVKRGFIPKIKSFLVFMQKRIERGDETVESIKDLVDFVGRKVPDSWIIISEMYEELGTKQSLEHAKRSLRNYLEGTYAPDKKLNVWLRLASLCKETSDIQGELNARTEICQLTNISLPIVSNEINMINRMLKSKKEQCGRDFDSYELELLIRKIASIFRKRLNEFDATDCSRIAWLYLTNNQKNDAKQMVKHGLSIDSENEYCQNLAQRLGVK